MTSYEMAALVSGEVEEYLAGRGISSETARTHRLGVVEDPAPGHDRYVGKLCIPYLHYTGYPLTVRFRCIADHGSGPGKGCSEAGHGKYLTMPDDPSRFYNVGAIMSAGSEFHLTEGEPDTWVLSQLGYPAGAIAGAQAWKRHYWVLLAGFSRVFVWGDGDSAGSDFVNKVGRALPRSRGVRVPKGEDVNSIFLTHGPDRIAELIEEAR